MNPDKSASLLEERLPRAARDGASRLARRLADLARPELADGRGRLGTVLDEEA